MVMETRRRRDSPERRRISPPRNFQQPLLEERVQHGVERREPNMHVPDPGNLNQPPPLSPSLPQTPSHSPPPSPLPPLAVIQEEWAQMMHNTDDIQRRNEHLQTQLDFL